MACKWKLIVYINSVYSWNNYSINCFNYVVFIIPDILLGIISRAFRPYTWKSFTYLDSPRRNRSSDYYSHISESEIQSFNQQWNTYEGAQGGNNVKSLLQKVIANCNTNAQEGARLVDLAITRANLVSRIIIKYEESDEFSIPLPKLDQ